MPVARYLAAISSGTVIATQTQSLPATEIREGLCQGDMVVANAGSSLHDGSEADFSRRRMHGAALNGPPRRAR